MFYLWINSAAGEYEITDSPERFDAHFDLVKEFSTKDAAEAEVAQRIQNSKAFVVFFDNAANAGFVSEEHALSGNWRGSKHHPYRCVAEFDKEDEAEAYLADLLR